MINIFKSPTERTIRTFEIVVNLVYNIALQISSRTSSNQFRIALQLGKTNLVMSSGNQLQLMDTL